MIERSGFYLQKYEFDCGAAAVAAMMVCGGAEVPEYEELLRILGTNEEGTKLNRVKEYLASEVGFEIDERRDSSIEDLKLQTDQGKMCLVLYQGWSEIDHVYDLEWGHYAVVVGVEDGKVFLLDPSATEDEGYGLGRRVIGVEEFDYRWIDKDDEVGLCDRWMLAVAAKTRL